ncbi:MAG: nuclear transport factor 2 family protein [Planctomycetota bacterium]|jgi:ketosteroid isomerase-like protein
MSLSPEQMDQQVNDHFGFEATDDIDGVMSTLTEDAEHEVIPSPVGVLNDPAEQRKYYTMLFESLEGESVTPIRRLYGEDFLVDETLWHGRITDGRPFLCDGKSGDVSFRLLHVFEFRSGKIRREQVWCDLAAIQRQLGER